MSNIHRPGRDSNIFMISSQTPFFGFAWKGESGREREREGVIEKNQCTQTGNLTIRQLERNKNKNKTKWKGKKKERWNREIPSSIK
jgi:hypothetical protein